MGDEGDADGCLGLAKQRHEGKNHNCKEQNAQSALPVLTEHVSSLKVKVAADEANRFYSTKVYMIKVYRTYANCATCNSNYSAAFCAFSLGGALLNECFGGKLGA